MKTVEELQKEVDLLTKKLEGRNKLINDYRIQIDKLSQFIDKQQREIIDLTYDPDKHTN